MFTQKCRKGLWSETYTFDSLVRISTQTQSFMRTVCLQARPSHSHWLPKVAAVIDCVGRLQTICGRSNGSSEFDTNGTSSQHLSYCHLQPILEELRVLHHLLPFQKTALNLPPKLQRIHHVNPVRKPPNALPHSQPPWAFHSLFLAAVHFTLQ